MDDASTEFASMADLLAHFDVEDPQSLVEVVVDPAVDVDVQLDQDETGAWELRMSGTMTIGMALEFPMTEDWFWECVHDLEDEVTAEE